MLDVHRHETHIHRPPMVASEQEKLDVTIQARRIADSDMKLIRERAAYEVGLAVLEAACRDDKHQRFVITDRDLAAVGGEAFSMLMEVTNEREKREVSACG